MELTPCSLLTIVSESALESTLVREIETLGARGYTITEARGKGGRGQRDAAWAPHANIRIEVLCDDDTAQAIAAAIRTRYYDDYSIVMFVGQVGVLRPEKFRT
jgi:hypothetical protein